MARHADFRGRQAGRRGSFDAVVAIAAVEAELADMVLVAERDRLGDSLPDAGEEAGTQQGRTTDREQDRRASQTPQHEASNAIGAPWKDLRHVLPDRLLCRLSEAGRRWIPNAGFSGRFRAGKNRRHRQGYLAPAAAAPRVTARCQAGGHAGVGLLM